MKKGRLEPPFPFTARRQACAKGYRLKVAHRKDEFRKTDISW